MNARCVVEPDLGGVVLGFNAHIEPYTTLREFVVVGHNVFIGEATTFGPGVVVGNKVKIGHHSCIDENVLLPNNTEIEPFSWVSMDPDTYELFTVKADPNHRFYWDVSLGKCVHAW